MNDTLRGFERFANLPDAEKQVFLALVSVGLTLAGRAFIHDPADRLVTALWGLNELQHNISSQIVALGRGGERHTEKMFWQILRQTAANHSISDALAEAVRFAGSPGLDL